jgi:hypothetical protein
MLLDITSTRAYELIEAPQLVREDKIIPNDFPACPNSTYAAGYDWLFVYERQIAAFLETWLKPFRYELIGQRGILCEALSNAFLHGHRKDPAKIIAVRVLLGKAGILVEVEDGGRGFAVKTVYDSFLKNRRYFSSAGNGLRLMAENPHFGVFHSPAGTIFYLLYRFDGDLDGVAAES